jgi:methionyl-tRNA formyltransferase
LKILFLGGNLSRVLYEWLLETDEDAFYTEEKVDAGFVKDLSPDMIISYNYRHILKKEVLSIPEKGSVNLHISYLPWNRGANANVWSFLEDTPKGVTIHLIDEGIDTGEILLQKEVVFDEDRETLKTSYENAHKEIQALFRENWNRIREGEIKPRKQSGEGTIHYVRDAGSFEPFIKEKGWDTPVSEIKGRLKPEGSRGE